MACDIASSVAVRWPSGFGREPPHLMPLEAKAIRHCLWPSGTSSQQPCCARLSGIGQGQGAPSRGPVRRGQPTSLRRFHGHIPSTSQPVVSTRVLSSQQMNGGVWDHPGSWLPGAEGCWDDRKVVSVGSSLASGLPGVQPAGAGLFGFSNVGLRRWPRNRQQTQGGVSTFLRGPPGLGPSAGVSAVRLLP